MILWGLCLLISPAVAGTVDSEFKPPPALLPNQIEPHLRLAQRSGAARETAFSLAVCILWQRLSHHALLLPELACGGVPSPSHIPSRQLLRLIQDHEATCRRPVHGQLAALLAGLAYLESNRVADADALLAQCATTSEQLPSLASRLREACLAYGGMAKVYISPPEQVRRAWSILEGGAWGDAANNYRLVQDTDHPLNQGSTAWDLLRAMHRTEDALTEKTRLLESRGIDNSLSMRPRLLVALETSKMHMAAWEDFPEGRLAHRLMDRTRDWLLAGLLTDNIPSPIQLPPAAVLREQAIVAGDWLGAYWAFLNQIATSPEPLSRSGLRPWFFRLATTLLATLESSQLTDLPGSGIYSILMTSSASGFDLAGGGIPALSVPRFGLVRASFTDRLPETCQTPAERLRVAWEGCPETFWRTFTLLHPGMTPPVAGDPEDTPAYSELAKAAMSLPQHCRQALGPFFPLALPPAQLFVPRDTAVIDVELREGQLYLTAILGQDSGPPIVRLIASKQPVLAGQVQRLTASLHFPDTHGVFSPELAHKVYQTIFGTVPELDSVPRWIVSMQLEGLDLPLDVLVTKPPDGCLEMPLPGKLPLTCRSVLFLGEHHDVRYANDLRDGLAWLVWRPPPWVQHSVAFFDPIYSNSEEDPRCVEDPVSCAGLQNKQERKDEFKANEKRYRGKGGNLQIPLEALPGCGNFNKVLERLPASQDGGLAIQQLGLALGWQVESYPGLQATKTAFLRALGSRPGTFLHVATHFLVPEVTLDPHERLANLACPFGLVFAAAARHSPIASGFLSLDELTMAGLDASGIAMATLSGCSGAGPIVSGWPPAHSLAAEFRQKGVRSALSFVWSVPDKRADQMVLDVLAEAIRSGDSVHSALHRSQARWRAQDPHPATWGSLVLHGPGDAISQRQRNLPPLGTYLSPHARTGRNHGTRLLVCGLGLMVSMVLLLWARRNARRIDSGRSGSESEVFRQEAP